MESIIDTPNLETLLKKHSRFFFYSLLSVLEVFKLKVLVFYSRIEGNKSKKITEYMNELALYHCGMIAAAFLPKKRETWSWLSFVDRIKLD